MRWREVDLDAGTWTIAKERCKNGKAHTVDLCPEAVLLLDPIGDAAVPRLRNSTDDFVFSTTGTTAVSGFSKVKVRIDARMQEILGERFPRQTLLLRSRFRPVTMPLARTFSTFAFTMCPESRSA